MEEKVQNALQNCSGGNVESFIHKEFDDTNSYYTILTINVLAGKIVKFPSTTALKGILNFFFHVCSWHLVYDSRFAGRTTGTNPCIRFLRFTTGAKVCILVLKK